MTSTEHAGVGAKRDAAAAALDDGAPQDGAGPAAAATAADAEAEAAQAAQRKARDEKHSKRMKRLMQTDPAAAERMEYRRRVGICCRDQDMAEALRCACVCARVWLWACCAVGVSMTFPSISPSRR